MEKAISSHYYNALVCLNGHVIDDRIRGQPQQVLNYCPKCGEQVISKCPKCEAVIVGLRLDEAHSTSPEPKKYCFDCGAPYPWTERYLAELQKIVQESKKLKKEERQQLSEILPDLIKDTPRTNRAALIFKNLMHKLAPETFDVIKTILAEIATEQAKRIIGLF